MRQITVVIWIVIWCSVLLEANKIPGYVPESQKRKPEVYHSIWEKTYGGDDNDIAQGIVALDGGQSIVVGTCKSFGAQREDMCVVRFDEKGAMKWRLILGGDRKDEGVAITRVADGNVMIVGSSKSFAKHYDRDLYVAKITLEGKVLWEKSIGGNRDEFAGGIAGTDDGGALIVGASNSFGNRYTDIYIVKLDQNGNVVSAKTMGGERADRATALTRTIDGNMVMVGYREKESSTNKDFFISKLTQDGKVLWAKTYGGEYEDILNGVTGTLDGGVVATGKTRSFGSDQTDLSVMKFSGEGKLLWHKIYGFKYYEYGNAITTTRDGGLMIVGGTNTLGRGGHSVYVLALSKAGKVVWSHVYGLREKDVAHGVARMSDGSVMVVGESDSFSRSSQFYMIRIEKKEPQPKEKTAKEERKAVVAK